MDILEGLEPVRRGPYTGALGWLGPDGAMATSILIRTFVADGRRLTLHVRDRARPGPHLGRRSAAPGRRHAPLGVRPRLPARRRDLRDAPGARQPPHRAA